ncbi:MAG: hypothetical protein FGM14_12635 [Flavobacteriales bacterium]|nr:hypothetical protein [Flavobacteriales bacterium]
MESTKKGMHACTPNLSNYRTTGESLTTGQIYKNESFIQSFLSQFNTAERRFYTGAIVELSKHLKQ